VDRRAHSDAGTPRRGAAIACVASGVVAKRRSALATG